MGDLIPGLPDDLAMECLIRMHFESFPDAVLTCKNWKHEIGSPEYLRRRNAGGHSQSIVVMTQEGYDIETRERVPDKMRLVVCELKTGDWRELPPIPGYFEAFPFSCRLAVVGFDLVVTGGWLPQSSSGSNGVFIYSFISNTWRRGADMLDAREYYGCVSDSDRVVYVVGGYIDRKLKRMNPALAYDVAKDEWVRLPDMAIKVAEGWVWKATFLSGKLHVFNPCSRNEGNSNLCVQSFDPATWTWGPVCNYLLDIARNEDPRVAGQVGNVYVYNNRVVTLLGDGKCQKVADLPIDPNSVCEMLTWNKHLLVIGSASAYKMRGWRTTNVVSLLDLESKEWTNLEAPISYSGDVQFACTAAI